MKKTFTLNGVFAFTIIMSMISAVIVSAQTGRNFASDKIDAADAPQSSSTVVINEVYGNSEATDSAYNADFIELYNLSDTPVNISDYSVQYYTSGQINAGAPTHTAHIPSGTMLAGKSYYVIRVSPIRATGAPLPCAALDDSASFAETGIAPDGGKLVLSSTGADLANCTQALNVVDRVGYGLTPAIPVICNETANAGQMSATASIQRKAGALDTDNNNADFMAGMAPTPCQQLLAPLAATVDVGGRVMDAYGRGIAKAFIRMMDGTGVVRTAYSTVSGSYKFADVEVGQTLILDATAKHYNFTEPTRVLSLNEESMTINFTAHKINRELLTVNAE